jgi:flagellar assembly protein FliH
MLAKVLKKEEAAQFTSFSLPAFGSGVWGFNDLTAGQSGGRDLNGTDPIANASAEAEQILREAREEAARIIAAASPNAAEQASAPSEDEIEAAIKSAVADQAADLRSELTATIENISSLADEVTKRAEADIVQLALQIAKKVVGREVTIDREIALTLVRVSLSKLHNRSIAQVHLNPEDLAFVEAHREACDFRGALELVADRSVSLGGCLVHTETGDIDARIESQFDVIAHGLLG